MQPKTYVFGYGSITNPASMAKDVNPKLFIKWAQLSGYERIFDMPVDGSLALNLRPNAEKTVDGILVEADGATLEALREREKGYEQVNVTSQMVEAFSGTVYAFIGPNEKHPELKIPRDYYEICTNAIPPTFREEWIGATVIENEIEG